MTGGPGHDVPPGYRPVDAGGGFIAANGPLYLLHLILRLSIHIAILT